MKVCDSFTSFRGLQSQTSVLKETCQSVIKDNSKFQRNKTQGVICKALVRID